MNLNSPLTIDDIELRVGQVSAKGFSLLVYKTARTDVKRLDEVHGSAWKNKFFYDSKGLLCCEISVYNSEIKEWVSRVDVGTESNTEKEKGSYSDAFKRAGFKWGIGNELYNSPFIFVSWEIETKGQRKVPKNFYNSNLSIKEFDSENGKVTKLTIDYKGKGTVFSMGGYNKPPAKKPARKMSELQTRLSNAIKSGNLDGKKWCEEQGIVSFFDITDEEALEYIERINGGEFND